MISAAPDVLVFARRAADHLGTRLASAPLPEPHPPLEAHGDDRLEAVLPVHDREEVRSLMWDLVGIVRSDERLELAEARVRQMAAQYAGLWSRSRPTPELVELRNLVQVALLIIQSARGRRESRGLHFNLNHPYRDNERFLRDTVLRRAAPTP